MSHKYTVTGDHGTIAIDFTGIPLSYDDDPDSDEGGYSELGIVRFDLDRYRRDFPGGLEGRTPNDYIDICNIGYWYTPAATVDGIVSYEEPCFTISSGKRPVPELATATPKVDTIWNGVFNLKAPLDAQIAALDKYGADVRWASIAKGALKRARAEVAEALREVELAEVDNG